MTALHVQFCEHSQRLYELVPKGEQFAINWTSADGLRTGAIGGLFGSEQAALGTLEWFCQDPLVARGAKE